MQSVVGSLGEKSSRMASLQSHSHAPQRQMDFFILATSTPVHAAKVSVISGAPTSSVSFIDGVKRSDRLSIVTSHEPQSCRPNMIEAEIVIEDGGDGRGGPRSSSSSSIVCHRATYAFVERGGGLLTSARACGARDWAPSLPILHAEEPTVLY